ncbi:MAG: hypothetical protein AMXMBFR33_42070 [Candidatus Xenobia bacterium]
MGRPFQARRAQRVSSNRSSSCNCHPRSTNNTSAGGNTRTAANRATQGAQGAQSGQSPQNAQKADPSGDKVQLSTKQEENAAGAQAAAAQGQNSNGFSNFLGNLAGNLGLDDISKKLTPLKLNDNDKALLSKAQDIHKKMAGADGVWDASDKARNLEQMKGDLNKIVDQKIGEEFERKTQGRTRIGTRFKQAVGRMHMKRHYGEYKADGMRQANAQASQGINDGQRQLGISDKTATQKTPGGPEKVQPLSVAEMETFGRAMKRLEELGKEQGKPGVKFTNGLPNQFFTDVLNGKLVPSGVDLTGGQ